MTIEYLKLQLKMASRKIADFGLHPVMGYMLLLLVFVVSSLLLFYKTTFAPYVYVIIALFFTTKLSEIRRNEFLKICFNNGSYRQLRIIENLVVITPFVIFLIYKSQIYPTLMLVGMAILLALLNFKTTYHITLPTPFFKKPFEFTVGFRNTFYLLIIAYFLTVMAIISDNFNLGILALILVFLCILTYYMKPENEYYVWSYRLTPSRFLTTKVQTALLYSSFLIAPIIISLSIFYVQFIGILLIFMLLGYLFLIATISAKYAAYPGELDLARAILLGICFAFPPLLIVIIPFFAHQAVTKLNEILK